MYFVNQVTWIPYQMASMLIQLKASGLLYEVETTGSKVNVIPLCATLFDIHRPL